MTESDKPGNIWRFRRAAPIPKNGKTLIMGILNLTPDSFSGGATPIPSADAALRQALQLIRDGADIIDVGAESSRPGAEPLTASEEIARLGDIVRRLAANTDKPISVDTYHLETAEHILAQGADIINDITALRGGWGRADRHATAMARLVAKEDAHAVLMHMPEPPQSMQNAPHYDDVVAQIREFLCERVELAIRQGVDGEKIWLDPGFGFGKDFEHNRQVLLHLGRIADLGYPVLVGLSRKRMIADALSLPVGERLEASIALAVIASLTGAALVRVHDVKATVRAVGMADAIRMLGKSAEIT